MPHAPTALTLALLAAAAAAPSPPPVAGPVRSRGIWVLDPEGNPAPPDAFRRGLQTSGLAFRGGTLWSVGDQRSNFPAHLYAVRPDTGRLLLPPVPIELPERTARTARYPSRPNPDCEAVAAVPGRPGVFLVSLEMDGNLLVEVRHEREKGRAVVRRVLRARFEPPVAPFRGDRNYGIEGIALAPEGRIYAAYERAGDGLPRLYEGRWPEEGTEIALRDLRVSFADPPPREGKGRWNANDLALVRDGDDRERLLVLARDNERIVVVDPARRAIVRIVDLDLRGPDGEPLMWASPEGLAVDPKGKRLWVVSDPDSVRGNFRRLRDKGPTGLYVDMAPLLFPFRLRDILP